MRVVLLVTDLELGGTPLRLARLARGLRGAGVDVHVGCLARLGPVGQALAAEGIPTFAGDAADARDVTALFQVAREVRRRAPDLIHSTLVHANVAGRLIGAVLRIPVVGSTATIEVERPWHRAAERVTACVDRAHIVNSRALAAHVRRAFGLPAERICVVPPSLGPAKLPERATAREVLGIPAHEFVVAWAGRLDRVKRLEIVVRTAEILTRVPSRFLLVGDGSERAHVEQLLRLSNAGRIVHLLGWREDVGSVLAAADAFLFPSRTEGMPNALLEALRAGAPVVGSDIPVLRELGGEPRSAGAGPVTVLARLITVAGPDPKDYAAALLRLRSDPALARSLGAAAADWARTALDPAATVRATLDVYARVLGRRAGGASAGR